MRSASRWLIAVALVLVVAGIAFVLYRNTTQDAGRVGSVQTQRLLWSRGAASTRRDAAHQKSNVGQIQVPSSIGDTSSRHTKERSHLLPLYREPRRLNEYKKLLTSQILYENGDNGPRYAALVMNIIDGNVSAVSEFLDSGGDPDTEVQLGSLASASESLLEFAIEAGRVSVVKEIVSRGASVNKVARDGETPLISAALAGEAGVVKYLLDRGAQVNKRDAANTTALSRAIESGSYETVLALLKDGASVELALGAGRKLPPELVRPSNTEFKKVRQLLIERGASMPQ